MRKLRKGAKPTILIRYGQRWTTAYLAAQDEKERKRREKWRHREIHEALTTETGGRCAYCETSVAAGSYPHVEHIIPKVRAREAAHEWENLTHTCPVCNTNKGDYHDDSLPLINPYVDSPEEKIFFEGPMAVPVLGDIRAEFAIRKLELNRYPLVKDRFDRLDKLMEALQRWSTVAEPMKEAIARGIRDDLERGEYSAAVRQFLARTGFPVDEHE